MKKNILIVFCSILAFADQTNDKNLKLDVDTAVAMATSWNKFVPTMSLNFALTRGIMTKKRVH